MIMFFTMKCCVIFVTALFCAFKVDADIGGFSNLKAAAKDGIDVIKNIPTDIKNNAQNFVDTAKMLGKDIMDNSKSIKSEKVEKVPVPEMIKNEGYPSETHTVTTSNGYILEVHRIPGDKTGKKNGKVVLLQHGLLGASSDWILFGPDHGLAYKLADQGFDVWMGNNRGNFYSRKHKTLDPLKDMLKFWAFSWHEMGMEDLPAMIDYILEKTSKENLYYVGHGQGTTTFFVMASSKPEYNAKIKAQLSMAPMGYMGNVFSPILRAIALKTFDMQALYQLIGNTEFLPNSGILDTITDVACSVNVGKVLCKNSMFAIAGFSPVQINSSSIPLISAHYPAGAATKQILHYTQEMNIRRFCQFDYGPLNLFQYKSPLPPAYDASKITAPVIFIYSGNDWLSSEIDSLQLFRELGNGKEKYRVNHGVWNNLDYIFGKDAPTVIYDKVLEYLKKY